ncbi:MAG TPA: YbhB/YbcL family Raf kinase inhibitor-like protein [Dongiaceae bacterium]
MTPASRFGVALTVAALAGALPALAPAWAESPVKELKVTIQDLAPNGRFADSQAFCIPATTGPATMGPDISPAIRWTKGPDGTRSFALILQDPDVPVDFSTANQAGQAIAVGAPRQTVTHWVLVDIPVKVTALKAGAEGDKLVAKGKPQLTTDHGRRGVNDYTTFLAGNPEMAGNYAGFDGPCPPWNDLRLHHYVLTVYALSVDKLPVGEKLGGRFDGKAMLAAITPYILAKGSAMATYSLNPAVK